MSERPDSFKITVTYGPDGELKEQAITPSFVSALTLVRSGAGLYRLPEPGDPVRIRMEDGTQFDGIWQADGTCLPMDDDATP